MKCFLKNAVILLIDTYRIEECLHGWVKCLVCVGCFKDGVLLDVLVLSFFMWCQPTIVVV